MPELDLPVLDVAGLRSLLPALCQGCRSFADLRRAPWLGAIQALLTHEQRQSLSREAPEQIEVPSGSRIKLQYEAGKPPILAVRIQEIFGLLETPRIARGRVAVLCHLSGSQPASATGDGRPGQLLAKHLSASPQRPPPPLPQNTPGPKTPTTQPPSTAPDENGERPRNNDLYNFAVGWALARRDSPQTG